MGPRRRRQAAAVALLVAGGCGAFSPAVRPAPATRSSLQLLWAARLSSARAGPVQPQPLDEDAVAPAAPGSVAAVANGDAVATAHSAPNGAASAAGVLYEESSRYADPRAVAGDCIIEVTSSEHLDRILATAAGASDGYSDVMGRWRQPHKLVILEVYANWCRACIGLRPQLLKLCAAHPEVLCLKLNKGDLAELADKLGVRGLPTIILYKGGKRVDHMTTADRDTIEEAIDDNT